MHISGRHLFTYRPPPDLQLPKKEEKEVEKVITVQEPRIKFREKKVTCLGTDIVGFKKRKINKAALQFRKREGDS